MSRRARCWMLIAAVATMLGWPAVALAQDGEAVAEVAGVVLADGTLRVTQTLTFDAPLDELTQVLALTRSIDSSHFHRYRISNISATVAGEAVDLATTTTATQVEIRMAVDGAGPLILAYDVHGATRTEQGQDGALTMLQWPLIQGLPVALSQVAGVVEGPGAPGHDRLRGRPPRQRRPVRGARRRHVRPAGCGVPGRPPRRGRRGGAQRRLPRG